MQVLLIKSVRFKAKSAFETCVQSITLALMKRLGFKFERQLKLLNT